MRGLARLFVYIVAVGFIVTMLIFISSNKYDDGSSINERRFGEPYSRLIQKRHTTLPVTAEDALVDPVKVTPAMPVIKFDLIQEDKVELISDENLERRNKVKEVIIIVMIFLRLSCKSLRFLSFFYFNC